MIFDKMLASTFDNTFITICVPLHVSGVIMEHIQNKIPYDDAWQHPPVLSTNSNGETVQTEQNH